MNVAQLIAKKRDSQTLTANEIQFLVDGFTAGKIPEYQMSAFAMAIFCRGMNFEETTALTRSMMESGRVLSWKKVAGFKCDKHSTGGTLDKLESIPRFQTNLPVAKFQRVVDKVGCAIIGQTADLCPADKKLYALRDVTATVPSLPLIVSSIMSKKLAEGIDGLVLDVKSGNGAFMQSDADALKLAEMLCAVGRRMGKRVTALLTDMNQPLGRWVGNAVETREAIECLQGNLQGDFAELSLELAAHMLVVGGVAELEAARQQVRDAITSGRAIEKFKECIVAQSGDPRVCDDVRLLPQAARQLVIRADRSGYVAHIQTDELGRIVQEWRGGRLRLEDRIDYGVGLEIQAKLGRGPEILDLSGYAQRRMEFDVLVHATPMGMQPRVDECLLPPEALEPGQIVYDIVYNPEETELLRRARARGCRVVGGLGMLVHQGVASFKSWTGVDPDPAFFYEGIRRALTTPPSGAGGRT